MPTKRATLALLLTVIVAPIAICVLLAVAGLLEAMDDAGGAFVVRRVALATGIVWLIGLVCLVVVQAVATLLRE